MANVNAAVTQLLPQAGSGSDGTRLGSLASTAKVAQNDTITITNAASVVKVFIQIASTGVMEAYTLSGNVITLTSATAGPVFGWVEYK